MYNLLGILEGYQDVELYIVVPIIELTQQNPFTAAERVEMIDRCMSCAGLAVKTAQFLPVNPVDSRLAHLRLQDVVPGYKVVFAGEEESYRIFRDGNYQLVRFDPPAERISGSIVRRQMLDGQNWRQLVPQAIADYIEERGLDRRIHHLPDGNKHPWQGRMPELDH